MNTAEDWAFPHLLSLRPWHLNIPSCDTLSYWILLVDLAKASQISADHWGYMMSAQFDSEDQAVLEEHLFSHPDLMPNPVLPIAPVLLTRMWSPFPLTSAHLGAPQHSEISKRGVAIAIWSPGTNSISVDKRPPDVVFYQTLMNSALEKASEMSSSICLVGQVGWSYSNSSGFGLSLRKLMKKAGFIEQRRKPET